MAKLLNKYITAVILITGFLVLAEAPAGFAMDRLGCMACHKYPGLAKLVKPDTLKVLHIDEEKQLNSPHGKVDCRKCHTKVKQVPHAGVTEVDCTTSCHAEDKEKIDAMGPSLSDFHKEERFAITRLDDKSSCRVCHPLYPHSKNIKVRAFINMHTGYLRCEVCHMTSDTSGDLTYEWQKPETVFFTGGPYGTHSKHKTKTPRSKKGTIARMLKIFSYDKPHTDENIETIYTLSRIAVFSTENGRKTLIMNTSDNAKAIKFKAGEKNMGPEKKKSELKYFHRNISKKEVSITCNNCHSPEGMFDFRKLGFNEKETKDLQYLNIKSLVTKYDVFYLPNLFGQ